MYAVDWSDTTVIGWVGNAIMFTTLLVAVLIAVTAQRASRRASDFAARVMTSERRLKIREQLRESDDADDLSAAIHEARTLFAADPAEVRIAERLYYSNASIPLDEFSDAYAYRPPPESLLQAVGETLQQRFDGQEMIAVLEGLRGYAHMTSPDRRESIAYWRLSPASRAARYVTNRLERQPYEPRLGPALRSFMAGPQPRLSQSILSCVAIRHWQPLECKLVLAKLALRNLGDALRNAWSTATAAEVHDTASRFFSESAIFDGVPVTSAVEADELEGCALAALDFLVYLAGTDPARSADLVIEALPKVEETLQQLRKNWQHTPASMVRRRGQFEPIYEWWEKRRSTMGEADSLAALTVTATLDRFNPPQLRAELERTRSAMLRRFGGRLGGGAAAAPDGPASPGTGERDLELPAEETDSQEAPRVDHSDEAPASDSDGPSAKPLE
jgi:hypothetical protein